MSSSLDNDTPLRRWLARQPGRCPGCGGHLKLQGHAPHCIFGERSNFHLSAEGKWFHNGRECQPARAGQPYGPRRPRRPRRPPAGGEDAREPV